MKTGTIMLFLLAVVIAFTTACSGSSESASETVTENLETQVQPLSPHKQQVRELLLSRVTDDTASFQYIDRVRFIEHVMPENYVSEQVNIADTVHIFRMIEDGDVVVAQSVLIYNRSDRSPEVVVDIFRYDGQKIVERWANIEVISDGDSWQTRTQGDTLITDLDKTEANKKLAEEYEKKNFQENYRTEIEETGEAGEDDGYQPDPGVFCDAIYAIYGEGNFVFVMQDITHIGGAVGGYSTANFNILQCKDNEVINRWTCSENFHYEGDYPNGKYKVLNE